MRCSSLLFWAAAASVTSAVAIKRQSSYESAVYWGQYDPERSLSDYCASSEGIDIIILSFLSNFGNGVSPNGWVGGVQINSDGSCSGDCSGLTSEIASCQAGGTKIFISIGGGGASWELTGTDDAQGVAWTLWNSYANPAVVDSSAPRPLGNVSIDGWDLDIESDSGSEYLPDLVNALRNNFASDTSKSYYISGAPQCPLPIADMNAVVEDSQFDYLFIQFYNNNCAAAEYTNSTGNNPDGNGQYNFGSWPAYLSGTSSANAKLHVGLPASPHAAGSDFFFVEPSDLPSLVSDSQGVSGFNGIMLWDAGHSDIVVEDGCNYAQEVRNVLDTGNAC